MAVPAQAGKSAPFCDAGGPAAGHEYVCKKGTEAVVDQLRIRVQRELLFVEELALPLTEVEQQGRASCCIDWRITFNKKDYLRLRRLDAPPELKARLEAGVRRERKADYSGAPYGKFDLDSNEGRCPFLDPDVEILIVIGDQRCADW